ncbi:unnamed protein product [Symbiodinium sp. CCMP2592]|nr:unnamed protein product [Symbiodinium sp. CCMP2592]
MSVYINEEEVPIWKDESSRELGDHLQNYRGHRRARLQARHLETRGGTQCQSRRARLQLPKQPPGPPPAVPKQQQGERREKDPDVVEFMTQFRQRHEATAPQGARMNFTQLKVEQVKESLQAVFNAEKERDVRTMTRTRTATHTGTEEVPTMSAPPPFASASQMMMSSSALTGSPTDMPVPTEMPSPARPSSDIEEATMALTETVLPTLPTQTAVAPEIEAPASQMMVSSSAAPGSPTDMPVPTEMPSPTSPGGDDDEDDTHTVETALPPTSSLGVPTLEVPTREMKKSAQMDASASQQMVSSSAVQASPTEMPVPTEVPSPTSPAGPEQEEAETIVTDTAPPPTRTLVAPTFEAALESAAISAQMDLDVPAPDESAVAGSAVMSDSGPGPRSPTDMPVGRGTILLSPEVPTDAKLWYLTWAIVSDFQICTCQSFEPQMHQAFQPVNENILQVENRVTDARGSNHIIPIKSE